MRTKIDEDDKTTALIFLPDGISTFEKREYMSLMEGGRTNASKEMYEAGKLFHSFADAKQ